MTIVNLWLKHATLFYTKMLFLTFQWKVDKVYIFAKVFGLKWSYIVPTNTFFGFIHVRPESRNPYEEDEKGIKSYLLIPAWLYWHLKHTHTDKTLLLYINNMLIKAPLQTKHMPFSPFGYVSKLCYCTHKRMFLLLNQKVI